MDLGIIGIHMPIVFEISFEFADESSYPIESN